MKSDPRPAPPRRFAFLWQHFAPYHHARLEAFCAYQPTIEIKAYEVANITRSHEWERSIKPVENLEMITLCPEQLAEKVSPFRVFWQLARRWSVCRPDLVFLPSFSPAYSTFALLLAKWMGIPVVLMTESHFLSGKNHRRNLAIKRWLVRQYDAAFIGGTAQRIFLEHLQVPSERIFDGYDAIDTREFGKVADQARVKAEATRAALGLPRNYILSLGRMIPKKNLGMLIEAYAQVWRSAQISWALVFVGSGPERSAVEKLAVSLGLKVPDRGEGAGGGDVVFLPFVQPDDVPKHYALARCFVLPSSVEEWGLVVNEALSCGCPAIVSACCGSAQDLIVPRVTGLRFNPVHEGELAEQILALYRAPASAAELAAAGRLHVAQWGLERFARGAALAAECALQSGD